MIAQIWKISLPKYFDIHKILNLGKIITKLDIILNPTIKLKKEDKITKMLKNAQKLIMLFVIGKDSKHETKKTSL